LRNPIRFDGAELTTRLPPPLLGEHTDEVLRER
jgi:crotonobetainyl-CoA:carnitine CoA-transferase CaiB-like acyl-CoA transferase